jgi:Zn-dependent M28 family amino/carboxypeptidase
MSSRLASSLLAVGLALTACRDARPQTAFSGEAALGYVRDQLAFGPRIPGTEGARKTGDWIVQKMRPLADTLIEQRWTHVTAKGDTLQLRNILARFRPAEKQRILYLTHWDTRPVADFSPILGDQTRPVPGANDGASGPALFIALAELLKKTPPQYGVDLLFVDGEDYGNFSTDTDVLLGSKYFADHLPEPGYQPLFGVLFDMIGDADLNIGQESFSVQAAPEVVARVWSVAEDLGYSKYFAQRSIGGVTDDHIPLIKKGLRVIDVIDIDYVEQQGPKNYHHTVYDTIDKVSAKSLQIVGDVAATLVTAR